MSEQGIRHLFLALIAVGSMADGELDESIIREQLLQGTAGR